MSIFRVPFTPEMPRGSVSELTGICQSLQVDCGVLEGMDCVIFYQQLE